LQWLPGWTDFDLEDWEMVKTTVLFAQIVEVLRRIMWNLYRVEWQCIKGDPEWHARLTVKEGDTEDQLLTEPEGVGGAGDAARSLAEAPWALCPVRAETRGEAAVEF
jgi:hypothetical protein